MEVMNSGWTESELCALYRDARNKKEQIKIIAELLGMTSTSLVIDILQRGGILEMDDKKKEEILREYYNNALSDSAIAKKTGVAQSQVSTFLRKKGLPPNGKIYNKKDEKKVEEIKSIEQLEDEAVKPIQPEAKPEIKPEIKQSLKAETLKNVNELKEILPNSMPVNVVAPKEDPIDFDIVETLTPQQYYELAKMTIQSINSMIETLRMVWEG